MDQTCRGLGDLPLEDIHLTCQERFQRGLLDLRIEQSPDLRQAEPQCAQFRDGPHAPQLAVPEVPIPGHGIDDRRGQQSLALPVPQHAPRDTGAVRDLSDAQHVDPHLTASHSVKVKNPR
jgi:hypothetical protein